MRCTSEWWGCWCGMYKHEYVCACARARVLCLCVCVVCVCVCVCLCVCVFKCVYKCSCLSVCVIHVSTPIFVLDICVMWCLRHIFLCVIYLLIFTFHLLIHFHICHVLMCFQYMNLWHRCVMHARMVVLRQMWVWTMLVLTCACVQALYTSTFVGGRSKCTGLCGWLSRAQSSMHSLWSCVRAPSPLPSPSTLLTASSPFSIWLPLYFLDHSPLPSL